MSDIIFTCLSCNQELKISSDLAGATVECPSCKNQMVVPEPVQPESRPLPPPPETRQVIERPPQSQAKNNGIPSQDLAIGLKTFGLEKVLFGMTRTFALIGSVIALLMITVVTIKLLFSHESMDISYNQVTAEILGGRSTGEESGNIESARAIQVEIPAKLKEYFKGDNEAVLKNWIENLDENQQKDFIRNLVRIVKKAESGKTDVHKAINAYKRLKFDRLRTIENKKYLVMIGRIGGIMFVCIMFLILSVLSLVLVMLAIERNTRQAEENHATI